MLSYHNFSVEIDHLFILVFLQQLLQLIYKVNKLGKPVSLGFLSPLVLEEW